MSLTVHDGQIVSHHKIYRDILRPSREDLLPFQEVGVADVLEGLDAGHALMDPAIRPVWTGAKIIGPALTVLTVPGDTLMLHYAVEVCQAGDVIVLASEEPNPSAVWGKMVSVVARARGVAGVIVDGFVRDIAYIRDAQLPVWTRAVSPRGSTRKGPGSLNVPICCGGVRVEPGDLIMADDDGVIVIPQAKRLAALEVGLRRVAREQKMMPQLLEGTSPFTILGLDQAVKGAGLEENPGRWQDEH